MKVENSTLSDIEEIFRLYRIASEYQKTKPGVVVWPEFDRAMVENELVENRQWKISIQGKMACTWAITFSDEQIWEEKNADPAMYIHRIATDPEFRGNNFVKKIVEWAIPFARMKDKQFIRLDTLGNNEKLIQHYTLAGFKFLGMFDLKNTDGLPDHYGTAPAALFEIDLGIENEQ